MRKIFRRRGFTLPEVLVTVTIVAVLAAVVVPATLNQVGKGDTASINGEVTALRTAISNFTTDTRQYPKNIEDLISLPTGRNDLYGNPYTAAALLAWKGPYFTTGQTVGVTGTYTTPAYGLILNSAFTKTADNYIALSFTNTNFSPTNIATLDRQYDNGNGVAPAAACSGTGTGSAAGQIQWTETPITGSCNVSAINWRIIQVAQ
jgi:prepilin-type N-terminal cleavage/methylation domain-containing protein